MSFLTKWLLSVIATAFLVSVCEALIPDKKVREVGRWIGGLLMLLALLSPLLQLRSERWTLSVDRYFSQTEEKEAAYREAQQDSYQAVITENCAAYIETAAEEQGLSLQVRADVGLSEDGVYQIEALYLSGPYDAEFSGWLTRELGVAAQDQIWDTKEMG